MEKKRINSFNKSKSNNANTNESSIKVIVQYAYTNETKTYQNINVNIRDGTISLQELLDELIRSNVSLLKNSISFYDDKLRSFIYGGRYPLENDMKVTLYFEDKKPYIIIKLRRIIVEPNLMRMDLNEENHENEDEASQKVIGINELSKRSKERKIGYIIEKVYLWRKLYNGYIDENGQKIKMTLEDAADKVGISKKSLDDYLIQLRIGRQNGFIFSEHKNDKVGVLRAFVKKYSNRANDIMTKY